MFSYTSYSQFNHLSLMQVKNTMLLVCLRFPALPRKVLGIVAHICMDVVKQPAFSSLLIFEKRCICNYFPFSPPSLLREKSTRISFGSGCPSGALLWYSSGCMIEIQRQYLLCPRSSSPHLFLPPFLHHFHPFSSLGSLCFLDFCKHGL